MNAMLSAALQLAELGFSVFPCVPGRKQPLTKNGLNDATTDAEQIEAWWSQNPNANIGLRTDGLLVVDVDVGADGSPNLWLTDDLDKLRDLAAAPISLTPRGGRHFIFKQPAGASYRNTAGKLAPHVDTRADGGYILVAPSKTIDGRSYRWAHDSAIDVAPGLLPEPPKWLLDMLADTPESGTPSTRTNRPQSANKIPSGQRNAALTSQAGALRRIGLSDGEIYGALSVVNADRCIPPLPDDEVRAIANSVARYEPDQISVAVVEHHAAQDRDAAGEGVAASSHADPGPLPKHLLRVPGFVGDVIDYMMATAIYPDETLSFAAALTLQGFLASRKVRDATNNRTNIFVLALANPGVGKDHPRKVCTNILLEVGLADHLGDSFASGEGIEDALRVRPAYLFQTDEVSGILNAIKSGKESRFEGIMNVLLKMYTSAASLYPTRVRAGREQAFIDQPGLTLFGTAVPKDCYDSISTRMLANGFFARLLILEASKRAKGQEPALLNLPEPIVTAAKYWATFEPGEKRANLAAWHPVPKLVEITPEALEIFKRFRDRMDGAYAIAEANQDEPTMAVVARAHEKSRRLALIHACSENHADPVISVDAAKWATELVEHLTKQMLFAASAYVSENEFDAKCNRFLSLLRKWRETNDGKPMPFWQVSRRLRGWPQRDLDDVAKVLILRGQVAHETYTTGGRPGQGYRLVA